MAKIRDTATVSRARIRSRPGVPERDRRRDALTSSTRPATVGTLPAWPGPLWPEPLWLALLCPVVRAEPAVWLGPVAWLAVWLTPGLPARPARDPRPGSCLGPCLGPCLDPRSRPASGLRVRPRSGPRRGLRLRPGRGPRAAAGVADLWWGLRRCAASTRGRR